MIKLSLNTAILIYTLVNVIALLLWWAYTEFKKSYKIRFALKSSLWKCTICTYVYTSGASKGITVCPRCGSYNSHNDL